MRSQSLVRISKRQDLCVFCALRYGNDAPRPRESFFRQTRSYKSTKPRPRPATAAAVAREEDDEAPQQTIHKPTPGTWGSLASRNPPNTPPDPPPTRTARSRPTPVLRPPRAAVSDIPLADQPDWVCGSCDHVNFPNRDKCIMCHDRKPLRPVLIDPKIAFGRPAAPPTRAIGRGWFDRPQPDQRYADQRGPQRDWQRDNGLSANKRHVPPTSQTGQEEEKDFKVRTYISTNDSIKAQSDRRPRSTHENSARSSRPVYSFRPRLGDELQTDPVPLFGRARDRQQDNSFGNFTATQKARQDESSVQSQPAPRGKGSLGNFRTNSNSTGKSGLEALLEATTPKRSSKGIEKSGMNASFEVNTPRRSSNGTEKSGMDALLEATAPKKSPWTLDEPGRKPKRVQETFPEIITPSTVFLSPEEQRRNDRFDPRLERKNSRLELEEEPGEPNKAESERRERDERKRNKNRRRSAFTEPEYGSQGAEDELLDQRQKKKKAKEKRTPQATDEKSRIYLPEFISVENLAKVLGTRFQDFVLRLEEMGFEDPRNDHILDAETSGLIAGEYNFEPVFGSTSTVKDLVARPQPEDRSVLPRRPPIVTIMGHVDHGKTTILDYLRKTSVAAGEHGGITQHIGAFAVTLPGTNERITFLDTPGHAAFLDMRRRGANVTDIVILVVAADDSVKPQTLEAIKHALDAKVDIIVAINKVDKEDANVDRVKQDLARHGLSVEDYGGNYQAIAVSGKTGKGMQELEEATVLLASVHDYRAEMDGLAEGWIIESKITPAGRVATILVRRGTMRPGDFIVAGTTWARIRTLRDDTGALVNEAPPGTPVQIDGWRGEDPSAGLEVLQAESEDHAKSVVEFRQDVAETARLTSDTAAINAARAEEAEARAKVLEWESQQDWADKNPGRRPKDNEGWIEGAAANGGVKQVHFVVKGDVAGSVEALVHAVSAVGNNEIKTNIIRSAVGIVTESDVQHLAATGETGFIVSFNQPVEGSISRLADASGLKILDHNIIYKVTDDVKERLEELLPPLVTQRVLGEADVGKIFEITVKKGKMKIAGCKISNGTISRDKKVRVLRKGQEVFNGMLDSLKNVKKDVTEMRKGSECGIGFQEWEEFLEGDQIQSYDEKHEKRTLY